MTRRLTLAAAVLAVLGAVTWFVLSRTPNPQQPMPDSVLAPSASHDGQALPRVASEAALESTHRSAIAASAEPPELSMAFDPSADGCVVFGRVSCANLAEFDPTRARVRITPAFGRVIDIVPDAHGDYEAHDLSIGRCSVSSTLEGCSNFQAQFAITSSDRRLRVDIPVQAIRQVRVFLNDTSGRAFPIVTPGNELAILSGTLSLVVEHDMPVVGKPLEAIEQRDIEVQWVGAKDGADATTPWRIVTLPRNVRWVMCLLLDGVVLGAAIVEPLAEAVNLTAALCPRVGRIEASVVDDATGVPVKGVIMTIRASGPNWSLDRKLWSDESGHFADDWVRAGSVRIGITSSRFARLALEVDLAPNQVTNLGEFRLAQPVSIAGFALLPDGASAVSREVYCWPQGAPDRASSSIGLLHTDAQGRFRFDSLPPGIYEIGTYTDKIDVKGYERALASGSEVRVGMRVDPAKTQVLARIDATRGNVKDVKITLVESLNSPSDVRR